MYFRNDVGGLYLTHTTRVGLQKVDGQAFWGNGAGPNVLNVSEILAGLPPQRRLDQIIGAPIRTETLNRLRGEGWILDSDQLALHQDHLHTGYTSEDETQNTR